MRLDKVHLTYCTNIHGGEKWKDHFNELKLNVPKIKEVVSPNSPFGLGLRLSACACEDLLKDENLAAFKSWLRDHDLYVFTMNGFPYGDFHLDRVKENVHAPDWTTQERLRYTHNMFSLLEKLLPEDMEGGISTSPLSYRFWFEQDSVVWSDMLTTATGHIIQVAEQLYEIALKTGKIMHLDIEPEPDGVLENGKEFIQWYEEYLLKQAYFHFQSKYNLDREQTKELINKHIQLCYDVCHAAVEFEDHGHLIKELTERKIKIGKFQISSALKIELSTAYLDRQKKGEILKEFDEQIYLHQVVARDNQGNLTKYKDINEALPHLNDLATTEWRSHFHIPIFLANYDKIASTQQDILDVLAIHRAQQVTQQIEIETYTWNVLPVKMQLPIYESIIREIAWLQSKI